MKDSSDLYKIANRLEERYDSPRHHNKSAGLPEAIFIILSQQTDEETYLETYRKLQDSFDSLEALAHSSEDTVAQIIEKGGLARRKARQILDLLKSVQEQFGRLTLEPLESWSLEEAEQFLVSLPGIGKKSARCILMYSFDRAVFPVDRHVRRILHRVGVYQHDGPIREFEDKLQEIVPEDIRYSLHVNLVAHGRQRCTSFDPNCSNCCLYDLCSYAAKQEREGHNYESQDSSSGKQMA